MIQSNQARNPDSSYKTGFMYSQNITVKNSTFRGARRNNLSFVDVNALVLEDCLIQNAGEGADGKTGVGWWGTLPRCSIDMEATRHYDYEEGEQVDSERVQNIVVRNNVFENAYNDDINLYTCDNVEIYGNDLSKAITSVYVAFEIEIYDNNIIANPSDEGQAISGISFRKYTSTVTGEDWTYNIHIYNNTVTGFRGGMNIGGYNVEANNNTITNFTQTGVGVRAGEILYIHDNTVSSNIVLAKGYYQQTGISWTDVRIINETITVPDVGIKFNGLVAGVGVGDNFVIDGCDITSTTLGTAMQINNSQNGEIKNNTLNGGIITQSNNTNVILTNNNL